MSIEFYDRHADAFFADTVCADMGVPRARFLAHVPARGRILDAGCGSGRDAKAFAKLGYEVEAFDASPEMVRLASSFTGLPIRLMTFEQIHWTARFNGIWASASLLHAPRDHLPRIAQRLEQALTDGGVLYASFKHGETEREKDGRRFTDMTEARLRAEFLPATSLELIEVWVSPDVRPGRSDEVWLNAIMRR
ncbi:class I SAM-dependent methyltransferase [Methylobacterium sp. WSM2598]|uniref:class I SAM-dependent methyltransferase n=1 Tax=Methylobacterium sp. WSM2598 TaxID=398261 RepID=UPI000369A4B4|nr:class I SAM-dependent methyltransferase [Methylobacterium sp. WSM2598]